jgi:hypothetical protein
MLGADMVVGHERQHLASRQSFDRGDKLGFHRVMEGAAGFMNDRGSVDHRAAGDVEG